MLPFLTPTEDFFLSSARLTRRNLLSYALLLGYSPSVSGLVMSFLLSPFHAAGWLERREDPLNEAVAGLPQKSSVLWVLFKEEVQVG